MSSGLTHHELESHVLSDFEIGIPAAIKGDLCSEIPDANATGLRDFGRDDAEESWINDDGMACFKGFGVLEAYLF